jgi:hypothetical protein
VPSWVDLPLLYDGLIQLSVWGEFISCGHPGNLPGVCWNEHSVSLVGRTSPLVVCPVQSTASTPHWTAAPLRLLLRVQASQHTTVLGKSWNASQENNGENYTTRMFDRCEGTGESSGPLGTAYFKSSYLLWLLTENKIIYCFVNIITINLQ